MRIILLITSISALLCTTTQGIFNIEEIDATFIKTNGKLRYNGEIYKHYFYLHSYEFLGLTWATQQYSLMILRTGKQFIFPEPLTLELKTKLLLAGTLLSATLSTGYLLWRKLHLPNLKLFYL